MNVVEQFAPNAGSVLFHIKDSSTKKSETLAFQLGFWIGYAEIVRLFEKLDAIVFGRSDAVNNGGDKSDEPCGVEERTI